MLEDTEWLDVLLSKTTTAPDGTAHTVFHPMYHEAKETFKQLHIILKLVWSVQNTQAEIDGFCDSRQIFTGYFSDI